MNIEEVIQHTIEEKTFSLEAIEAIKQLRDANEELKSAKRRLEQELEEEKDKSKQLNDLLKEAKTALSNKSSELTELKKREAKALRLEIENEYLRRRGDEHRDTFMALCRNTTVRQRIHGQEPLVMPPYSSCGADYGPCVGTGYVDKTTEVSEE